nr:bromodomain and WD repeat-containing protein 3-like [Leptinotarsa decemlineata]
MDPLHLEWFYYNLKFQLPKELFFHTDYRPLVRDSNHYVLDEQTQVPPHLMPPPFLVDIDGNPYPPMLQRLVPGRELCNVEQLVPNIVIGNEGTQEVIQDIPQNHVGFVHNEDEDIREPGFRLGRRHSNREFERIRQSTGDWQSDPNIEWKINVLVPPLIKSVLDRAKQVREALKDAELEEYQKQLRQRPHMISINTSSNIKKQEEKKKKNAKYITRSLKTFEYREDEPESSGNENFSESSGYSDWVAEEKPERPKRSNRRPNTNHVQYSEEEDEDDDYENDHDYGEGPSSSSRSRENHVNRKKENKSVKHKENNASRSKVNNSNHTSNDFDMSSDDEDVSNTTTENHLGKAKLIIRLSKTTAGSTYTAIPSTSTLHSNSKLKVSEQYRLSEWLSETRPRKSPYYPQLGDEIVYFIQGHQLYLNIVEIKKTYEICIKELPWNKMTIQDHEFVKVIGIQYEIKPPRLCCLKLALLDDEGKLTGKVFTVKYHDMPDVLDFFVLKQMYNTALSRDWKIGDKFRCMIDDEWWIGQIMNKSPASESFPDSVFLCYEIMWTNGERERMSPWDMEPIDPERVPEDENQAMPVLEQELTSILYKTVDCDWPYNDLATITNHVVTGITKVMELAIAEPFLVPVDINVYPEYAMFIEYPIDLSTIKARFENNFYRRLTAAQFDIRYLATNAEKFNLKHSTIVKQSRIVTELCLRIVKGCSDYIDVPSLYHRIVDSYNSCDSEEELDVPPSSSKNIRTSSKRLKRNPNDWKAEAVNLVESLWKSKDSEPFREPVDPETYPDYYNIIKNPMDLGTVRENLKNSKYDVPQQFIIDMRLIFQNSRLYTPNKKSLIYDMTVRLSDLFEELTKRLMSKWKTAKRRQNRKRISSSDENEVSISTTSSDEEVMEKFTSGSQLEVDSDTDDDIPLNILRSKTNTESDTTSQSTFSRGMKSKKRNAGSEDEYSPSANYRQSAKNNKYKSSSSEEEIENSSSSDEDESPERKCNLRQRPVRKKILLYESSDSENSSNTNKRIKRGVKRGFDSDSDSKSSHSTLPLVNNEGSFISNVSSRGRIRKLTERAKAMFKKR